VDGGEGDIPMSDVASMTDDELRQANFSLVYQHIDENDPPMTEEEETFYYAVCAELEKRGLELVSWI
jgi:hypothetical protein